MLNIVKGVDRPAPLAPSAPLSPAERAAAIATLTSAFVADPVIRFMYPSAQDYFAAFPRFLDAFGGAAFEKGTVRLADGGACAAMWMPPGVFPDDAAVMDVVEKTVSTDVRADLDPVLEQMGEAHPETPHWYLPWFGTDTASQSRGLGSSLMRHCLAAIDADGLPAYLESPNPRNVPFYDRHGFRVVGEARHGKCPPVTFMWREAAR